MSKNLNSIFLMGISLSLMYCSAPKRHGFVRSYTPLIGQPKTVKSKNGKKKAVVGQSFEGSISYYGPGFHGKKTASGTPYNQNALTCAHKTLPFGTRLKVTLLKTGKSVKLTVNDRGPYAHGRILDVSVKAAEVLGLKKYGHGKAKLEVIN